jgi:hypothetical protein
MIHTGAGLVFRNAQQRGQTLTRSGNRLDRLVRRTPRRMPMNCYKCGRFIGSDGDPNVCEVDIGVYEAGYPTCGRCLKRDASNDPAHRTPGAGSTEED